MTDPQTKPGDPYHLLTTEESARIEQIQPMLVAIMHAVPTLTQEQAMAVASVLLAGSAAQNEVA